MDTDGLRATLHINGEPSLNQLVKFHDKIKDSAHTAFQIVVDLSDVYKFPSIAGAILGDLFVKLQKKCRQIAIINVDALGLHFREKHDESSRLKFVSSESEAEEFFQQTVLKVLAVEDDDVTAKLIEKYLTARNLNVTMAGSAEEGIQHANDNKPDLILLDIHLPEMNGLEAAKRIRKNPLMANIPIIMLTADSEKETVREAIKLDIEGYVIKPFNPKTFFYKILEALSDE